MRFMRGQLTGSALHAIFTVTRATSGRQGLGGSLVGVVWTQLTLPFAWGRSVLSRDDQGGAKFYEYLVGAFGALHCNVQPLRSAIAAAFRAFDEKWQIFSPRSECRP